MEPKKYNRIKGLSSIRRLPRLSKIRLGVKVKKAKPDPRCKHDRNGICMFCGIPREVPYFVCPPEVKKIYGEQPAQLDIMFPVEDETITFPQSYKYYKAQSLRCKGDGDTAMRRVAELTEDQRKQLNGDIPDDKESLVEINCPCPLLETGQCKQAANLMVLLPKVSMSGVFQLDTGSYNNIIRINSAIDYVRGLLGRVSLVPLVLKRVPETIEYEGKKATHYLLSLEFDGNIDAVNRLRQNTNLVLERVQNLALPSPIEDGPEPTGEAIIPEEEAPKAPDTLPTNVDTSQADVIIGPEGAERLRNMLVDHGLTRAKLLIHINKTYKVQKEEDLKLSDYDDVFDWILENATININKG